MYTWISFCGYVIWPHCAQRQDVCCPLRCLVLPPVIPASSMTLQRYCTISSAKAFNASVASWQKNHTMGGRVVLGKGAFQGSKVVTCYMAAFMDNMENSKVLTIIKCTIRQCIYWKGITCQQNSTIWIYMILCALCILYFSKLLNQDFSPCFIEEYPTDIYTTTTKNDILYSLRR